MYTLEFAPTFNRSYKKVVKDNVLLQKRLEKVLKLLVQNPRQLSLHTHKVDSKDFKDVWSSRVTGDIRIIWEYDKNYTFHILVLKVGGHSGSNKVYAKAS